MRMNSSLFIGDEHGYMYDLKGVRPMDATLQRTATMTVAKLKESGVWGPVWSGSIINCLSGPGDELMIDTDCAPVVEELHPDVVSRSVAYPIIADIKDRVNSFSFCQIKAISRDDNSLAHGLAAHWEMRLANCGILIVRASLADPLKTNSEVKFWFYSSKPHLAEFLKRFEE